MTITVRQCLSPGRMLQPERMAAPTPRIIPTLFNQFDAAGVTWKGYAQDLRNHPGREDGLAGSPGTLANTPDKNPKVMKIQGEVYSQRAERERSLMASNIFRWAARRS